jgi:hypothetical protein
MRLRIASTVTPKAAAASGTPRDVVFIEEAGWYYHDLTADEYAMFDGAL